MLTVGALLILLGAAYPKSLVIPNRLWMGLSEILSFVLTRVILALIFFIIVTPIGLIRRISGKETLRRRAGRAESYWKLYNARQRDPRHFEKMF
jgi:hypothetical protein